MPAIAIGVFLVVTGIASWPRLGAQRLPATWRSAGSRSVCVKSARSRSRSRGEAALGRAAGTSEGPLPAIEKLLSKTGAGTWPDPS